MFMSFCTRMCEYVPLFACVCVFYAVTAAAASAAATAPLR